MRRYTVDELVAEHKIGKGGWPSLLIPAMQQVESGVVQVHSLSFPLAVEDIFITGPFRVSDVQ